MLNALAWRLLLALGILCLALLSPAPGLSFEPRALYVADVPCRGGQKLACDVYLPKEGGPWPAILIRTPYDPRFKLLLKTVGRLTAAGYAVVIGHCRGRFDSGGEFYPFRFEAQDGYDTVDWIVRQPWAGGAVGVMGGSYQGMAAWQLASLKHPHVKALFIMAAPADFYKDIAYPGGAFALEAEAHWLFLVNRRTDQNPFFTDWKNALTHLPLSELDIKLGCRLPVLEDFLSQSRYGKFWKELYCLDSIYERVGVPVFLAGGWNDALAAPTLSSFNRLRQLFRDKPGPDLAVTCLIGPWDHLGTMRGDVTRFGDIDYGAGARVDMDGLAVQWFNLWLRGRPPITWQPRPLRYFVTGANIWLDADQWPPASVKEQNYFLHSQGHANAAVGDGRLDTVAPGSEPADHFLYDPDKPVPTIMSHRAVFGTGVKDVRALEMRPDVLIYTSQPLAADLFVSGNPRIVLNVASDCPDTDFAAWLCDVKKDGRSFALEDGIVRVSRFPARSPDRELTSGNPCQVEIELGSLAHVFKAGRRLRLIVSSSNFPAYNRNLNTGGNSWQEVKGRIASQTIYHDNSASSYLVLPVVVPGEPLTKAMPVVSRARR